MQQNVAIFHGGWTTVNDATAIYGSYRKCCNKVPCTLLEEGRKIGFENTVKLASVREKVKWNETANSSYCHYCNRYYNNRNLIAGIREPETAQLDFTSLIRSTFDL